MPVTSTSGQGRPKGALNKGTKDVRALAQSYGPRAIGILVQLAGLEPPETIDPPSEWARIAAIKELLDRAYGKASQVLANDPDNPLTVQFVIRAPAKSESTQAWLQQYAPKQLEGDAVDANVDTESADTPVSTE